MSHQTYEAGEIAYVSTAESNVREICNVIFDSAEFLLTTGKTSPAASFSSDCDHETDQNKVNLVDVSPAKQEKTSPIELDEVNVETNRTSARAAVIAMSFPRATETNPFVPTSDSRSSSPSVLSISHCPCVKLY